jgi:hypothetical protein
MTVARRTLTLAAVAATLFTTTASADARFDYLLYCAGCHLENGSGAPPEVPNLRANLDVFARMPEGRAYLARVPGASQAPLSDIRLAAVFNWMIEAFYTSTDVAPYTAEEIASYRGEALLDPLKHRTRLLKAATGQPEPPAEGGR